MKRAKIVMTLGLALVAAAATPSLSLADGTWNRRNDPANFFGASYQSRLDNLPLAGASEVKPWVGWYWPNNQQGVSSRWAAANPQESAAIAPSKEEIIRKKGNSIDYLSPTEKFDILHGRYDYPLTGRVRAFTNRHNSSWDGICHGASPAAINVTEPKDVTLVNPDGIPVPFFADDIKALVSYFYAFEASSNVRQIGTRCNTGTDERPGDTPACRDIDPSAFHIAITNQIGLQRKAFIADLDPGAEVWNYPVYRYESRIANPDLSVPPTATPGTVKRVEIQTITYSPRYVGPARNDDNPERAAEKASDYPREYWYRLDLDTAGRIIGGEWDNNSHPDFIWVQDKAEFTGYFADLKKLLP